MPRPSESFPQSPHAMVVVLGDLGRSPRMVNHARALLARGWRVTLAGYLENAPPSDLLAEARLRMVDLTAQGAGRLRAWWRLRRLLKTDASWSLVVAQNPPGFPILLALPGRSANRRVVLDWHNLGETLYRLARPGSRLRAGLYGLCERSAAGRADKAVAVSAALAARVPGGAAVLRDAPPESFCAAARAPADRLEWWARVFPGIEPPAREAAWIAAPSSWGADEDMGAILRAARHWAGKRDEWGAARPVTILASGRGQRREAFEREAARLPRGPVTVRTLWAPAEAYPVLLAAADAGLCLHRSSSGADLPMKLADMRGAGIPALVFDYGEVLREAGSADAGRILFKDDAGLRDAILRVAAGAAPRPAPCPREARWEAAWGRVFGDWCAEIEAREGLA